MECASESRYNEVGAEHFEMDGNMCYGEAVSKPGKVVRDNGKNCVNKVVPSLLLLVVLALLLGVAGACVALGLEITELKSETASLDTRQQNLDMLLIRIEARFDLFYKQTSQNYSATELQLHMLHQQFGQNISAAEDLFSQQLDEDCSEFRNQIRQLNVSTQLLVNDIIERIPSGQSMFNPAVSCATLPPSSPSGYYWVRTSNGSAVRVYCDMTRSCGGVTGGWVRVAELNMTNSSHQCPSGFRERNDSDIRTCARSEHSPGCSSPENFIINHGIQYSVICGRIIGYQFASTDAFTGNDDINSVYVDGVSLTHGNPKQHIWTFAAARDEVAVADCPCLDQDQRTSTDDPPPAFVGNDYFCDTGSISLFRVNTFYNDNPLWDGAGCGPQSTCCSFNNPPWFYKQLPRPTTDGIEMRLCRTDYASGEDVTIELVDIYIQ